jgi:hypothetical protein
MNTEYTNPSNDIGHAILCASCTAEVLGEWDDDDFVDLIETGLKLATDDPCEHCDDEG